MISAYVIGVPGAGKSTLLRALTAHLDVGWERQPFAHGVYRRSGDGHDLAAQIGGHHPEFPGTDRLSMGVQPRAIEWVGTRPYPVVIGEGDRLATAGFLDALEAASDRFDLVLLDTPPEFAADRRAVRGSAQNETWLKGRLTKVQRLATARGAIRLDGSMPVDDLVEIARARVPALAALGL